MDAEKLAYFKQRLLEQREHLLAEVQQLQEATTVLNQDSEFGISNHAADDATDVYEREKNLALVEDREELIDQVNAALERVASGTYGTCLKTGQPIPLERLEVLPYAAYLVTAQPSQGRS